MVAPRAQEFTAPHFCGTDKIWLLHLSSSRVDDYDPMPSEKRIKASMHLSMELCNCLFFPLCGFILVPIQFKRMIAVAKWLKVVFF